tara:strand:- start:79 stop:297 length:219 start_codon:yes stop_codon:yes gene_type:complete
MGNTIAKLFETDARNNEGMGGPTGGYQPPAQQPAPQVTPFSMPKDSPGTAFSLQRATNNPQSTSHAYLQKFS